MMEGYPSSESYCGLAQRSQRGAIFQIVKANEEDNMDNLQNYG